MAPTILLECTENKTLKRSFAMMGKSQKFSRGFSSSFVPDYRHAAETMGELEGFGTLGRADSEDSSAPKRKCISLNNDRGGSFNVPLQVISFAKLSGSERKELELRLRVELERVQMLQKMFASRNVAAVSGVAVSSSTNGHGKKSGSNGPHLKRGSSGRFESTKKRPQPQMSGSNSNAAIMKQCESILNKLRTHQFGWVFNTPVDAVALNIPDYYTVIKHPMDLGTIKNKLTSGAYSSPLAFVADVRLTFTNAMIYNPLGNDVHIMADKLSKFFESKWKPIGKKLSGADLYVNREAEAVKPAALQPKKRKTSPMTSNVELEKVIPKVTVEERQRLNNCLATMIEDMPDQIVEFLRQHIKSTNESGEEEEIEVDIDALSDDVLLELKKLLDDCLPEKRNQPKAKAEPSEMEILNEFGLSNSSMHLLHKGNEPAEEDVDIGGNDPPIAGYPPVEIEKDAMHRKYISSSSSSSDSGSSSDSDSGSSSGSESEDRGASPSNTAKGNTRPGTMQDQDKSDIMNAHDQNRTRNGLGQPEQDGYAKPVDFESDGHQEGENAPERQVSPEKLYRAALLRSRFADTILKAREKTLDQGEKGDPEKLRREREGLERQQREEKARLQAEAKAAEAARRRTEAEAAAEAKRKRELEREAARQALLKIEKTVEINENSLILKDLEMLGTVPGEHVPSSVDETSPDHSIDGMGGFMLGGSNPLQQLGLYMKEDEEEDEEGPEPEPRSAPPIDVEEGEID